MNYEQLLDKISRRINERVNELGLTQYELADTLGVSRSTLQRRLYYVDTMKLHQLKSLCEVLGLSFNKILSMEDEI